MNGGGGRAIVYGGLFPGETAFRRFQVLAPKPEAFQTRPAIANLPDGDLIVAWK